jgi:glycosyltransferase involved in cell wall biosynthesis
MRVAAFHSELDRKRGSSLAFLNICLALRRRGHDVHVWSFNVDDWYRKTLDEVGIPSTSMDHHHLEPLGVHLIVTNNNRARKVFRRLKTDMEAMDIAYLHGNQWTPLSLPILDMPRGYYCDEPPRHYYEPDLINVTLGKKLGKALGYFSRSSDMRSDHDSVVTADQVAANSDYTRGYIKRVYDVEATTVYLGVDHDTFRPRPEEEKEDMVVSVGALYPLKAHDFIIRVLGRIPLDTRPRLVVVGSGEQQGQLQALASSQGVAMEIVSEIGTQELARTYARARLTLIAHIREPFGFVSIESQSCGTPVVAVGEAGLEETVVEGTGMLVPRDEAQFAKAVEGLLGDDQLRADMSAKGRQRVKARFHWDRTGENMEALLERARKGHQNR